MGHRSTNSMAVVALSLLMTLAQSAGADEVERVLGKASRHVVAEMADMEARPQDWEEGKFVPAPLPVPRPSESDLPPAFVKAFPAAKGGAAFLPSLISPPPTLSFAALGATGWIPPDTHGSVGPNHLLVTLNGGVRIQDRAGGIISTVTLVNFWAGLGGFDVFDPKSFYDPYGGRFMVVSSAERSSPNAALMIGVSQTSDPTGAWNLYRIDADPAGVTWPDYPSMGFTKDWIIVQANMFTNVSNTFNHVAIWAFDKAALYAGGGANFTRFTTTGDGTSIDGTWAPAETYDPNLETAYMLQMYHHSSGGSGLIQMATIAGPVGDEQLTLGPLMATPPGNLWVAISNDLLPQLGTSNKISAFDDRMLSVTYRNGSLWAAHQIFLPPFPSTVNRCSIEWFEISPDSTILQRGLIDDPNGVEMYAYPSITVNRNDEVVVGYSSFSPTQYASGAYSFRRPGDPPNTMRSNATLKAGEATYFASFGGRNRWGDFSSTTVDPLNDVDMWTIQEYAASPADTWGTWWGMIAPECGNGATDLEEECDDANFDSSDGCTNWCTTCGNTIVTAPEECDDGGLVDDDGCDSNCTFTTCGNGVLTSGETCDDGNLTDNDGCDSNCTPTACGNGAVSVIEECDDGNVTDDDGCDSNCRVTGCGNGVVTSGETCDDGNLDDDDGCDSNCTPTGCGNGVVTSGEECDDGNLVNGDDCEDDCRITPRHDSVLLASKPLSFTIGAGKSEKVKKVRFAVFNADAADSHTIQLSLSDDCPGGGLVVDTPDFDKQTAGAQDSILVPPLGKAKATVLVTATSAFTTFNKKAPNRCTLTVSADAPDVGNVDPTPTNNVFPVEINVIDKNDVGQTAVHETVVASLRVVRLTIADGATDKVGKGKPIVINADILPTPEVAADTIMVTVSDGDCPAGTVGLADFEPRTVGDQETANVVGGKKAKAQVPITVTPPNFTTPSKKTPSRCTALITASGPGGDTDATNNTAALVIDVVDKNDY